MSHSQSIHDCFCLSLHILCIECDNTYPIASYGASFATSKGNCEAVEQTNNPATTIVDIVSNSVEPSSTELPTVPHSDSNTRYCKCRQSYSFRSCSFTTLIDNPRIHCHVWTCEGVRESENYDCLSGACDEVDWSRLGYLHI